jgi:hypothetical protein
MRYWNGFTATSEIVDEVDKGIWGSHIVACEELFPSSGVHDVVSQNSSTETCQRDQFQRSPVSTANSVIVVVHFLPSIIVAITESVAKHNMTSAKNSCEECLWRKEQNLEQLTQRSGVIRGKALAVQLVKKFPAAIGTRTGFRSHTFDPVWNHQNAFHVYAVL